jgi:hypothetical protein
MESMNMADNQSREEIRRNNHGELTVKVRADVDVSDAITGLKALQREAKEATQALRELEATKISEPNVINITINTTNTDAKTLVETLERELAKRLRTRSV